MAFGKSYAPYKKPYGKPEYKNFRVKTPIKSFRDLEVYSETVKYSAEIFNIVSRVRRKKVSGRLNDEYEKLYELAKYVPKLIAESYGDKFSSMALAVNKLENTMRLIANLVTKIDCLVGLVEDEEIRDDLIKIIAKYQKQRVKINNLKKAWSRAFPYPKSYRGEETGSKPAQSPKPD